MNKERHLKEGISTFYIFFHQMFLADPFFKPDMEQIQKVVQQHTFDQHQQIVEFLL